MNVNPFRRETDGKTIRSAESVRNARGSCNIQLKDSTCRDLGLEPELRHPETDEHRILKTHFPPLFPERRRRLPRPSLPGGNVTRFRHRQEPAESQEVCRRRKLVRDVPARLFS